MVETRASDRLPPDEPGQRMQRVRVGVTGLAAIVLVVLLATAIASGVRRQAAVDAGVAPPPVVPTGAQPTNAVDPNAEPLAQLGAAPGGAADTKAAPKVRPNESSDFAAFNAESRDAELEISCRTPSVHRPLVGTSMEHCANLPLQPA